MPEARSTRFGLGWAGRRLSRAGLAACVAITGLALVGRPGVAARAEAATRHWAYVAPLLPPLPTVRNLDWCRGPIDRFVLARLEREGLAPSPPAAPASLLRRVTLDLTGLPPTVDEADRFLRDPDPNRYERQVDRLLASPAFGERWARPWLDLARYADSHGFQRDDLREIWPFRDWVIDALNADMPYDRFTIEQLAGDLLPDRTESQRVATGFHRCATLNVEAGSEPEESRTNQILDRVNTTATVWLGTSLACAQCHDHKYDPFSQRDYFRMFAVFNNTRIEAERADPKVPGSIRFLREGMLLRDPARERLRFELEGLDLELEQQERSGVMPERRPRLLAERERLRAELRYSRPPTTLVMEELPEPRPAFVFVRGDFRQRGAAVEPGVPAELFTVGSVPPRRWHRLELARWLVRRDNPLTARVAVNRWWAELFGAGIVRTPEDFGSRGERPTHPELLDWLAWSYSAPRGSVRGLSRQGMAWSPKTLLRTIVTSSTYRQSSRLPPDLLRRDPQNRLLARGPRFRMDAETIRDQALAVSGLLSTRRGGPPVRPPQPTGYWKKIGGDPIEYVESSGEDRYRRGIYVVWKRSAPYPSFASFDATQRLTCTVSRPRTNTPMQAITLLNDPAFVEAGQALARRMLTDAGSASDRDRVGYGFRRCLTRQPSAGELAVLYRLLVESRAVAGEDRAHPLAAVDPLPPGVSASEFSAWYAVATTLLNLDETITKG